MNQGTGPTTTKTWVGTVWVSKGGEKVLCLENERYGENGIGSEVQGVTETIRG